METRADYSFTEADFTDFILLSGTADIKINGSHPYSAQITAYEVNPNGGNSRLGYTSVSWGNDGDSSSKEWEIVILSSSLPREVTFEVSASGISWETGITKQVSNADIPNIAIVIDKQTITLRGTADITVNGEPVGGGTGEYYISLSLYDNQESNSQQIGSTGIYADRTWSMTIGAPASQTTYYLAVSIENNTGGGRYRARNVKEVTVSNTDVSGITVTKAFITLSGSANFKIGGVSASDYQLSVFDSSGNQRGSGSFDSQNWSLLAESLNGDVSFDAMIYTNDDRSSFVFERNVGSTTVNGTAKTGIELAADIKVKNVTVSVTQGATPVSGYGVYAAEQI
jgi:hypothetical protein